MTEKQARQLLPGTVVMWEDNPDDKGTVREITDLGVLIDWEGGFQFMLWFESATYISTWTPEA